jgi:hypothetical protein
MSQLIGILKGTPWWVYFLFFYLLYKGVQALHPRVIFLPKLFILPLIFIIWGLYSIVSFKLNSMVDVSLWLLTMFGGAFWGLRMTKTMSIQADKKEHLISLPGSKRTLILSIMVFATRYFFAYIYAIYPESRQNWIVIGLDLIASGVITGFLCGMSIGYWRRFQRSEHTDLIQKQ